MFIPAYYKYNAQLSALEKTTKINNMQRKTVVDTKEGRLKYLDTC